MLKHKKVRKFLRKYFTQENTPRVEEVRKISSAACIVNLDEFTEVPALSGFSGALGLAPDDFHIITYTKNPKPHKDLAYPMFSFKDVNWKLQLKESQTKTFLEKEYDILINYFTREELPLVFLSTLTQARIRVGFSALPEKYNDIMLAVPVEKPGLFKEELLKYLTILKKI